MPLVLLHPLPLDATIWPEEMRSLCGRVVAPDLYDLGDSIEAWAAGVLELAGPGPLALVGCSVGGSCAIEIAHLAPTRVGLLVLVGAKAAHRPEPAFRDEAVRVLATEGMPGAWPRYWAPLFGPNADPEVVERARRIALAQPVDAVIRGVGVFHGRPDRAGFLEGMDLPIHVVSGEHDRHPSHAAALASRLRRGRFHSVLGAGHYVPLESPAAFATIVGSALRAHGSTAEAVPSR